MTNSIQDKFIKNTLYVVIGIALIGLIAIQPYNIYCKVKKSCNPVTFSSFKLNKVGEKELTINFVAKIPDELKNKVEFEVEKSQIKILNGKKIINSYKIKNLSNQPIRASSEFFIEPKSIKKYLEQIECLCMQEILIDKNEEEKMRVNLRIDAEIEKDEELKNLENVKIEYMINLQ